ncbi:unnamed protein product [Rhizophagus irregularis]|uniref:Uncharacterized protein n=1 Tax=Rhizophagus irregularis TaxID=588596 RepID=A0A915YT08_9GLOM|nr:unnamed protein product [Rhizophagus irregularis]
MEKENNKSNNFVNTSCFPSTISNDDLQVLHVTFDESTKEKLCNHRLKPSLIKKINELLDLKGTSWDITIKYRTRNKELCIEEFKFSSLFDPSTIAHETSEVNQYKKWLELYSEKYRNYLLEKKKKIPWTMETQSDCVEEEEILHETNKIVDSNKESPSHIENASYSQTVIEETEYKCIEVAVPNKNPNYSEQLNEILNIITDICDDGNNEGRVYPHEIEQLWREYAATLHIKKWLLKSKFGYKELIREFNELGYSISRDTLYRFYKRRTIPIRINRNAIMAWIFREKRIISAWMDCYKVFRQQASPRCLVV